MRIRSLLVAAAALTVAVVPARADIFTFTGALDQTDPTYNRLVEGLSELSTVGTAVRYDVGQFTVGTSGEYTFLTTGTFDTFAFLYGPSFNAATPLANALIGNDDLVSFTTSGLAYNLTAGTNYFYITTAFANADRGLYSNTIGGPGVITAVPDAGGAALLALGLGLLGLRRSRSPGRPA